MSPKYRLLTSQEVEEWFKIKQSTLQTMRSRPGKDPLPFSKIGGRVRYREDLLLKWLDRNTFYAAEEYFEKNAR